jgi:phosphomannomutase/phosphoglucomutase
MKEDNALLGGEMSGHMFFKDRYEGFDDAFYAGMRIIEILSKYDKTLSELADEIPKYKSTPELRLDCGTDDNKFKLMKELDKYFKKYYKVIDVDGVRILFEDGWALVRSSNTQPVIVLRMEAKTDKSLKKIIKTIYEKLSQYKEIDTEELKKYF